MPDGHGLVPRYARKGIKDTGKIPDRAKKSPFGDLRNANKGLRLAFIKRGACMGRGHGEDAERRPQGEECPREMLAAAEEKRQA